jgi:hypothetical protein
MGTTAKRDSGQSLIETALILPVLITLILNAVNVGYYFLVALNMTAAPRYAVLYSIQGGQTPQVPAVPSAGPTTDVTSVSALALASFGGAINGGSSAIIRVCTKSNGVTGSGSSLKASCTVYNSGSDPFGTVAADNRAPSFILHRVDIQYTVTPLIPGGAFNLAVPSNLNFRRSISMRAMD